MLTKAEINERQREYHRKNRDTINLRQKEYYHRKKNAGRCVRGCGNAIKPGRARCDECVKDHYKKYHYKTVVQKLYKRIKKFTRIIELQCEVIAQLKEELNEYRRIHNRDSVSTLQRVDTSTSSSRGESIKDTMQVLS